jgi:hypothetical protein
LFVTRYTAYCSVILSPLTSSHDHLTIKERRNQKRFHKKRLSGSAETQLQISRIELDGNGHTRTQTPRREAKKNISEKRKAAAKTVKQQKAKHLKGMEGGRHHAPASVLSLVTPLCGSRQ